MNPIPTATPDLSESLIRSAPVFQVEKDLELAERHLADGQIFEAEELFERRLESGQASRARMGLAKCAFYRKDLHEALASLQMLEQMVPDYPDLDNTMGAVLFGLGLAGEARERFLKAVRCDPDNPIAWRNLAQVQLSDGVTDGCVVACQRALDLDPQDEVTRALMAQATQPTPEPPAPEPSAAPIPPAAIPSAAANPSAAPIPTPEPQPTTIDGVTTASLQARVDDRGYLVEILRSTDDHFTRFGQVYLVGNVKAGTVRAFHKHAAMWDWFFVSHGMAKFVLVDDRPDSATYRNMQVVVTGDRNPMLVSVPPGVFHGWISLSDDTQMISTASEVYNRAEPDEVRIPPDSFGDVWTVKGR